MLSTTRRALAMAWVIVVGLFGVVVAGVLAYGLSPAAAKTSRKAAPPPPLHYIGKNQQALSNGGLYNCKVYAAGSQPFVRILVDCRLTRVAGAALGKA